MNKQDLRYTALLGKAGGKPFQEKSLAVIPTEAPHARTAPDDWIASVCSHPKQQCSVVCLTFSGLVAWQKPGATKRKPFLEPGLALAWNSSSCLGLKRLSDTQVTFRPQPEGGFLKYSLWCPKPEFIACELVLKGENWRINHLILYRQATPRRNRMWTCV